MSEGHQLYTPPRSNGSQSSSPPSTTPSSSPSLLSSLRNFRYQPKTVPKIGVNTTSNKICSSIPSSSSSSANLPSNTNKQDTSAIKCASTQTQTSISKSLHRHEAMKRLNVSDVNTEMSPMKKDKLSNGLPSKVSSPPKIDALEKSIDYVKSLFPNKDRMEIQDMLVRCNWKTIDVVEKLHASFNILEAKASGTTEANPTPKKVWKRIQTVRPSSSNSSVPSTIVRQEKLNVDEQDSSDEDEFSSKPKRQKILEFLSKSSINELTSVSGCTLKKAEIIMKLRPFKHWRDLDEKLDQNNFTTASLYGNVIEMIRLRNIVSSLMKACADLSQSMAFKLCELSATHSSNLSEQPSSLASGLKLAGYQMVGLNWLRLLHEQDVNGILADEMGLGKTVQVIAFLAYLKENNLKTGVHLIVVPSSTLENWSNELARWCPDLKVETYYGSQEERRNIRFWWRCDKNKEAVNEVDVLLTTYNLVNSTPDDKCFFRKLEIQYIVYDEAHMLKNMATQRYSSLMKIEAEHRVLLTGTPLQNNLVELMSLLIFVMPHMFSDKQEDLKRLFKSNPKAANDEDKNTFEKDKIMQAKKIMEPFVLRRLKKDVLQDLPAKTEQIVYCNLSQLQSDRYNELIAEFQNDSDSEVGDDADCPESDDLVEPDDGAGLTAGLTGSMGMMMMLRRAANHPALLSNHYAKKLKTITKRLKMDTLYREENDNNILANLQEMSDHQIHQLCCKYKSISDFKLNESYLLDSGKFNKFDEILPKLKCEGHRVLIFSQFRQAMDVICNYFQIKGYKYLRLDGQTPVVERQSLVDEFNKDDSIFIFLLSTKAGGFGINLASADTVIIHDIDLNPYNDKQAEDRCHRVGQTRPVTIMRFISKNTIEESMLKIALSKLSLEQQISHGGNSKLGEKKLMNLLKEALKHQNE